MKWFLFIVNVKEIEWCCNILCWAYFEYNTPLKTSFYWVVNDLKKTKLQAKLAQQKVALLAANSPVSTQFHAKSGIYQTIILLVIPCHKLIIGLKNQHYCSLEN